MKFHDRIHAAYILTHELRKYKHADGVVLAIPQGGVPVGFVIAQQLGLPLEVIMVKKIGHPANPEYAIGSVSPSELILSHTSDVSKTYITMEIKRLREHMRLKYQIYMDNREPQALSGKTVILADDGLATGNTMMACIAHVKKSKPQKIVVAAPEKISRLADEVICIYTTPDFYAVGQFYDSFHEVQDKEVVRLIRKANAKEQERVT
jgi:putative phosphoribosyl transferase